MEIQAAEIPRVEIKRISAQISDLQKRRNNLLSAIENGLYAPNLNDRIEELNKKEQTLSDELTILKQKKPTIPREYLKWWLNSFRDGDMDDETFCKKIINTFVAGIVVSSDASVVYLNVTNQKEGSNSLLEVSLNEIRSNPQKWSVYLPFLLLYVETI